MSPVFLSIFEVRRLFLDELTVPCRDFGGLKVVVVDDEPNGVLQVFAHFEVLSFGAKGVDVDGSPIADNPRPFGGAW